MKKLKQFYIKGISYYTYDIDEAYERYKKNHKVQTGDMYKIGNSFFRDIGGKLIKILIKRKK